MCFLYATYILVSCFLYAFRSAASFPKAAAVPSSRANSEDAKNGESEAQPGASELSLNEDSKARQGQSTCHTAFQFPFGDWVSNPWSKSREKANTRFVLFYLHMELQIGGSF